MVTVSGRLASEDVFFLAMQLLNPCQNLTNETFALILDFQVSHKEMASCQVS